MNDAGQPFGEVIVFMPSSGQGKSRYVQIIASAPNEQLSDTGTATIVQGGELDSIYAARLKLKVLVEVGMVGRSLDSIIFDEIEPAQDFHHITPPKNAPHGPQRKGTGGKLKRW